YILNHVKLDIGKYDFGDNTTCKHQFVSYLIQHPKYQKKVFSILSNAYSHLIEQIFSNRSKVFTHQQL
ncbi:hypothetical protein, partial [Acinetobacter baumannii]